MIKHYLNSVNVFWLLFYDIACKEKKRSKVCYHTDTMDQELILLT